MLSRETADALARLTACPLCGHERQRLSRRQTNFDRVISLLGIRPVRCMKCQHRHFRFLPAASWGRSKRRALPLARPVGGGVTNQVKHSLDDRVGTALRAARQSGLLGSENPVGSGPVN